MKILYQLPGPLHKTDLGMAEVARRQEFLNARAAAGTEVVVGTTPSGPPSIESSWDADIAAANMLPVLRQSVGDGGFDAVIIGCFGDPGLAAAREVLDVPAIGPGEAAAHLALQLGTRFAIVSPLEGATNRTRARLRGQGLAEGFAGVRAMGLSVLELARQDPRAFDKVAAACERAVREDGADVLVLGCMSMAFLDATHALQERTGVPVVNPVTASLKTAEMAVSMGLCHSKAAYPVPPKLDTV